MGAETPTFMNQATTHQGNFLVRWFDFTKKAYRNQTVCVLTALLAGTAIAFSLTAIRGIPTPVYQDEFGYLLSADTFASGRITNPTHPKWQHFESYHIIHQPTYTSKYHPAQSLTLAVGQWLGHPIFGACLATGLSLAALVWMLTGWLPRKYFWLAVLFVICHPGIQITWGQSYWGGAVALAGASLLLGGFARLSKDFQVKYAVIAAFGTVLLATSRPFEGAVLTAMVGLSLVWKLLRNQNWKIRPFLMRVMVPGFCVLGVGGALMLTYNTAVTGSPFKMPYKVHESAYGWTPLFLWQTAGEKPEYRHPDMEKGYVWDKEITESHFKSAFDVVTIKLGSIPRMLYFFCGGGLIFAWLGLPRLLKKSKYKLALLIAVPAFLAGMVTPWEWAHYCAPAAPLVMLLLLGCLIEIWRRTRRVPVLRFGVVMVIVFFQINWCLSVHQSQAKIRQTPWANQKLAIESNLKEQAGQDLVLVRYSEHHDPSSVGL